MLGLLADEMTETSAGASLSTRSSCAPDMEEVPGRGKKTDSSKSVDVHAFENLDAGFGRVVVGIGRSEIGRKGLVVSVLME